jgi:hypothetical protein
VGASLNFATFTRRQLQYVWIGIAARFGLEYANRKKKIRIVGKEEPMTSFQECKYNYYLVKKVPPENELGEKTSGVY